MTPTTTRERPHRVLLVREWDSQHSGSGCCGRLGGVTDDLGRPEDYARSRACMKDMGAVYRALRAALPDVDVTIVDPRNWAWLVPAVIRDARRTGLSWVAAAVQVSRATAPAAIVVDGVVVHSGHVPTAAAAVDTVRSRLRRPTRTIDAGAPRSEKTWSGLPPRHTRTPTASRRGRRDAR